MNGDSVLPCRFDAGGRTVDLFPGREEDAPLIVLNTFSGEGESVRKILMEMNCPDFSLAAISGLDWNRDMSPWDSPSIFKDEPPFTGGADEYLSLLTGEIIPRCGGAPAWLGIAGYSLAGLFAVYSMYRTGLFSRIASMSGSFWFPGFTEFALHMEPVKKPERLYLSLGDRESRTRNPSMKTVQTCTEQLAAFYEEKGIKTVFRLNPGNHFQEADRRSALGILWLLSE